MKNSKIAVFGLGHMGLPTACLFARKELNVIGIEKDPEKIKKINNGQSPIIEPGLDELVFKCVKKGYLSATNDGLQVCEDSEIMIVIVPTPRDELNRSDLTAVKSVCETISKGLKKGDLVIIESTVPQGTCDKFIAPILEKSGLKASQDFSLAYTPERALPQNTLYEMVHNARVIGGIDEKSTDRAISLYSKIVKGEIIKVKNLITAETIKLIENTYRDLNIALANELAIICEEMGVDVIEAIEAANHHPRVNIHTPGPGVGGHCLSIDPYFLVETAFELDIDATLIRTARATNEGMPIHVYKLIVEALAEVDKTIVGSNIGILGVAYKGNVADARETPAAPLINKLLENNAKVIVNDPFVNEMEIKSLKAIPGNLEDVLHCDCVVLITDHDQYKNITPSMIKNKVFICTRPILDPTAFIESGIIFKGIGRP